MGKNREDSKDTDKDTKSKVSSGHRRPRNNRSRRHDEKGAPKGYKTTSASNDFSWHSPDAALLERASDISWSYQAGEPIDFMRALGRSLRTDGTSKFNQAGIMCIRDYINCGGMGYINHNIVNYPGVNPTYNAANTLLTEMRSKARIRNTYDAPDVFMLNVAMMDIYAAVTLAKRLAATVKMFTYQNRYLPEQLMEVQGFSYSWFKQNLYTFVTRLNVLISEINKIYVPDRMHIFQLINQRYSNYYTEGESIKDQIYLFTPAFLGKIVFNPSSDFAACVRPTLIMPGKCIVANEAINEIQYDGTSLLTGDDLLRAIQEMINAVIEHDATADITGDMENCFGAENRFLLTPCEPEAIAVPVFDEEILETIHNMSWSSLVHGAFSRYRATTLANPELSEYPRQFVTEQLASNNAIGVYDWFQKPTEGLTDETKNYYHTEASFRLLDVHKDPNNQKTFAITRLRNYPMYINSNGNYLGSRIHFASDLICQVVFVYYEDNTWWRIAPDQLVPNNDVNMFRKMAAISAFHYKPYFIPVNSANAISCWPMGESDIYSCIPDQDTLLNMDRISLLSLFGAYNNV